MVGFLLILSTSTLTATLRLAANLALDVGSKDKAVQCSLLLLLGQRRRSICETCDSGM
jgi:hypothetical protein